MKHLHHFLIGSIFLSACTAQPSGMGMNHGNMDHGMMRKDNTVDAGETPTLLSGKDIDLSTLPEAKASQIMEVHDGDSIDLHPEIVKKTINGTSFAFYAYNGQFPGPTIKVTQGSTFTVRVKNTIDQPTTVHWHGIRIDNRFDGAAGLTQEPIEPGDSYTYTVTVPDEGMYWYHPHVREDMQQDLGLYGNLWVTPKNTKTYAAVNREIPVIVDDLLLGNNGTPLSYGKEEADHALMGRFGNVMLINGQINPQLAEANNGDVLRFFFTNAANTRTFKLAFANAQMKIVGGDGGKIATEKFVDSVTIAPSERVIVDVLFEQAGEVTLKHIGPQQYALGTVTVRNAPSSPSYAGTFPFVSTDETMTAAAELVQEYSERDPDETIHLSVKGHMMGGMMMDHGTATDGIEWEDSMSMMNSMATKATIQWKLIDEASGKENMDIHYIFTKGEKRKIRIINDKNSSHPMQHPIHFHGQRFLVLSVNGIPVEHLVWKDTVLVAKGTTVDILLDVTNPGDWMIHCHIAEHLSNGMMGMFTVQ